ncbi:helix-turn-helix transcriptional regulator [Metasolibacillus sp. FSL H7-0170]|uniref:helix-turn-helix domain-containing protein n=1 Tax=Metasolibacillus sp. FSL H7-0170 TaxID=2921431 RepID=UPI0031591295
MLTIDVGKLIKQCRKKMGWSQEEAAYRMHVNQSTISRIEKNLIACEVNFLVRFSKLTNTEDIVIAALFSIDVISQSIPLLSMFAFMRFIF